MTKTEMAKAVRDHPSAAADLLWQFYRLQEESEPRWGEIDAFLQSLPNGPKLFKAAKRAARKLFGLPS